MVSLDGSMSCGLDLEAASGARLYDLLAVWRSSDLETCHEPRKAPRLVKESIVIVDGDGLSGLGGGFAVGETAAGTRRLCVRIRSIWLSQTNQLSNERKEIRSADSILT